MLNWLSPSVPQLLPGASCSHELIKQLSCCITALDGLLLSRVYVLTSYQSCAWSFVSVTSFDSHPDWEWEDLVSPFYRQG